jgi:hypothetical protein
MMSKRKISTLTVALLCSLLPAISVAEGLAGVVLAQGTLAIDRHVIGGGGAHLETGIYALDGTIGQPVVGMISSTPYELCSGFWCGTGERSYVYLPLVLK